MNVPFGLKQAIMCPTDKHMIPMWSTNFIFKRNFNCVCAETSMKVGTAYTEKNIIRITLKVTNVDIFLRNIPK